MAARSRSNSVAFAVTLDPISSGSIAVVATPIEAGHRLTASRATVVVSLWREGASVIRGKITHGSGAVAYFQGGEPLAEIARLLCLRLDRST